MSVKFIGKLERAAFHPNLATLKRTDTGEFVAQFPIAQFSLLLGARKYGYWDVVQTSNTYAFGEEVPREKIEGPANADG